MEKRRTKEWQVARLAEYGLSHMPLEECRYMQFQAGDILFREGMPITRLAIVANGHAKACSAAPNGKNLILSHYISDGLLGDVEFAMGLREAAATVVAITELECIMVSFQKCEEERNSNVIFLNKILGGLARKMLSSSDNYMAAALCSGEERLCNYILQAAHNDIFSDILTDTASSVGMSYRHMFRLLSQLCQEGVLEKRESGYHILNREGLMRRGGSLFDR